MLKKILIGLGSFIVLLLTAAFILPIVYKGKIEIMQWTVIQRSWFMDRDLRISFQPRKGYGIRVIENAIWSSEKSYEIYIEINNSDFLINGR